MWPMLLPLLHSPLPSLDVPSARHSGGTGRSGTVGATNVLQRAGAVDTATRDSHAFHMGLRRSCSGAREYRCRTGRSPPSPVGEGARLAGSGGWGDRARGFGSGRGSGSVTVLSAMLRRGMMLYREATRSNEGRLRKWAGGGGLIRPDDIATAGGGVAMKAPVDSLNSRCRARIAERAASLDARRWRCSFFSCTSTGSLHGHMLSQILCGVSINAPLNAKICGE